MLCDLRNYSLELHGISTHQKDQCIRFWTCATSSIIFLGCESASYITEENTTKLQKIEPCLWKKEESSSTTVCLLFSPLCEGMYCVPLTVIFLFSSEGSLWDLEVPQVSRKQIQIVLSWSIWCMIISFTLERPIYSCTQHWLFFLFSPKSVLFECIQQLQELITYQCSLTWFEIISAMISNILNLTSTLEE